MLPSYLSTNFDLAVPMVASVLPGSGRETSNQRGKSDWAARPQSTLRRHRPNCFVIASSSGGTAPIEANPGALSGLSTMADPLMALVWRGMGCGVRIWQPQPAGLWSARRFASLRTHSCPFGLHEMIPSNQPAAKTKTKKNHRNYVYPS